MRIAWKLIRDATKYIYANRRLFVRLLLSTVSLPLFIIFGLTIFLKEVYGQNLSESLATLFQILFFVPADDFVLFIQSPSPVPADDFVLFMQSPSPVLSEFVLFYLILATLTLLTGSICFRLNPIYKEGLYPHGFSFEAVQFEVKGYELTDGTTFINTLQLLKYMWQMPFAWVRAPILCYVCGYLLFGFFVFIFKFFFFLFWILCGLISEYIYEFDITFFMGPNGPNDFLWLVFILIFSTAMLLLGHSFRFVKTEM